MAGGPDPEGLPISEDLLGKAPKGAVVFDTVYTPIETPLLRAAKKLGMPTINGVEMFVQQAALQFEAWTNCEAPAELFVQIVRERLETTTAR